jgi:hypothetical protein
MTAPEPAPHPLEALLVRGADSRSTPVGPRRLNKYGAAPRVRRALALGSCTCSSPSARAWRAAEAARRALSEGESVAARLDAVRARLLDAFIKDERDVEVALMPSGTDVEYVPLALALARDPRPITNVVVAPDAVGSGTPMASAGLYFNEVTPVSKTRTRGEPLHPELAARVEVVTIRARDARGAPLSPEQVDARVARAVEQAVAAGRGVVLHRVAHCKTGMRVPSGDALADLAAGLDVPPVVVVDAAQGRVSRASIERFVSRGWLVSVTGSKFFGGPPFCGALFMPRAAIGLPEGALGRLPAWIGEFVSRDLAPPAWRAAADWPARDETGLLLRWEAALAEIEAFFDTPLQTRERVLDAFARLAPAALAGVEGVDVLEDVSPERTCGPLEDHQTVFSFTARDAQGRSWSRERLLALHHALNTRDERAFHLGQPVWLGEEASGPLYALRVALGAPLLCDVASDAALGADLDARLGWLEGALGALADALTQTLPHIEEPS